jgi:hypothetical protein
VHKFSNALLRLLALLFNIIPQSTDVSSNQIQSPPWNIPVQFTIPHVLRDLSRFLLVIFAAKLMGAAAATINFNY